ncbi:Flp family type IVb pilin [Cupriavidus necator]|jgi:Flp pilus assembly pilin Flp|uniref:hypothetical protein n=1 Tax=Cupriavidus TaxID=106589 RepID=UPI000306A463|nr:MULTISPECIES: hypothetical protein [Cupriavidus]EON21813.1 hypothetical protein C265_01485 [Cupriavidus sp. GA3-3]QQB77150.1 hypothetical protein I6H87_02100 [Cupriavidus necator]QUN29290.1 hypothetical protein KB879_04865 [Cupriavidus sp. KK10]UIF87023.1 hypothetical protein KAF44_05350 [Cupriavidus necator]WKA41888.1 hypothetical protein QWP09_04955 [Cupriavidus necator]
MAIRSRRQRGQAAFEYIVITLLVVAVLVAGGDNSVISMLAAAFRSFFQAYSFSLSLP